MEPHCSFTLASRRILARQGTQRRHKPLPSVGMPALPCAQCKTAQPPTPLCSIYGSKSERDTGVFFFFFFFC
jgi:hypothetical protein